MFLGLDLHTLDIRYVRYNVSYPKSACQEADHDFHRVCLRAIAASEAAQTRALTLPFCSTGDLQTVAPYGLLW